VESGEICNMVPSPVPLVITVPPAPAPVSVSPFVIVSVLPQVHPPAGTVTVPPRGALVMAVCTSLSEQELAVAVDALLGMAQPRNANVSIGMMTVALRFVIS
jgi:hypothetical protein